MAIFSHLKDTATVNKHRLEMLFDGIFAIAMTILILEVKAPEVHGGMSNHALLEAISESIPTMLSYLLSFLVLGNLWYRHNEQYKHFEHISGAIFWLQLIQLALAAFFPYCASLFGRFFQTPVTFIFYVTPVLLYAIAQALSWLIAKRHDAISSQIDSTTYHRINRSNWLHVFNLSLTLLIVSTPFVYVEWIKH